MRQLRCFTALSGTLQLLWKTECGIPVAKGLVTDIPVIVMLIQKIFHVHRNSADTKAALTGIRLFRRDPAGGKKTILTVDGVGQFDCEMPTGFRARCVLAELPASDPNQALFHSVEGNLEVAGLIEFIPIRENLTEVQLTLEYSIKSTFHSLLDCVTHSTEHFIDRQLERLEYWLDGAAVGTLGDHSPADFGDSFPQFAH